MAFVDGSKRALVIDNGSFRIKAGFSRDEAPRALFPSVVGRVKHQGIMVGTDKKDAVVGHTAVKRRGVLNLTSPIQRGAVTDWQNAEKIWHHTFYNELQVPPEEHPILLTEPPLNSTKTREKMTTVMFEVFCAPSVYIGNTAVLSLYASGRTSGCVFESGHGVSNAVPVYEGYALPHAIQQLSWGGQDANGYLVNLLRDRGYLFTTPSELDSVCRIKEVLGEVALNYKASCSRFLGKNGHKFEKKFVLPDSSVISIGKERLQVAEAFFQPDLMGQKDVGIHKTIVHSIRKCDLGVSRLFFKNIILSGGSTLFKGIEHRLLGELKKVVPADMAVNVIAPAERRYSAWIGGSMLSSFSTFPCMLMTKADFDEHGASIVHRKCF